jgi:hypothetical protein
MSNPSTVLLKTLETKELITVNVDDVRAVEKINNLVRVFFIDNTSITVDEDYTYLKRQLPVSYKKEANESVTKPIEKATTKPEERFFQPVSETFMKTVSKEISDLKQSYKELKELDTKRQRLIFLMISFGAILSVFMLLDIITEALKK